MDIKEIQNLIKFVSKSGAEVIRVERIDGSEDRYIHPIGNPNGEGAMFMQMNRNKKGLTLNPTKDGSQEIVKKLRKKHHGTDTTS